MSNSSTYLKIKQIKFLRILLIPIYKMFIDFYWFIYSKVLRNKVCIKTANKSLLNFHPKGHIAKELLLGKFELSEKLFIENSLKDNSNVINIGANIGYYTVLAAKISNKGMIHSVEPSIINYTRLLENIHLNNLNNVITYKLALGQKKDFLNLYFDANNPQLDSHYTLLDNNGLNGDIEKVEVLPLDDLLENFPQFDFAIIDVEGFEYNLLLGATKFLEINSCTTYMIEVTKSENQVINFMKNFGFKVFKILHDGSLEETTLTHGNLIFKKI